MQARRALRSADGARRHQGLRRTAAEALPPDWPEPPTTAAHVLSGRVTDQASMHVERAAAARLLS